MGTAPNRPDQIENLRQRERRLTEKIREITAELSNLDNSRRKLIRDRDKIWKAVRELEPHGASINSDTIPTLKNIRFLKAWAAVHKELSGTHTPTGAHHQSLYDVVCQVLPDLKETTFRTYLHRMKNEKRIIKSLQTGRWNLIQKSTKGQISDMN